jgi:hypothetical protein
MSPDVERCKRSIPVDKRGIHVSRIGVVLPEDGPRGVDAHDKGASLPESWHLEVHKLSIIVSNETNEQGRFVVITSDASTRIYSYRGNVVEIEHATGAINDRHHPSWVSNKAVWVTARSSNRTGVVDALSTAAPGGPRTIKRSECLCAGGTRTNDKHMKAR